MATTKRKKRSLFKMLRYRKSDVGHNLICAVQRWIHANSGNATILGGIGVRPTGIDWRYDVVISVLGKQPKKAESDTK